MVPAAMAAALLLGGCCLVDEDVSDCDVEYKIDYELRLVTNMTTELETVLDLESDIYVQDALREYLKDIFTDFAHDVDLSFYDVVPPMERLHHERHIMDANQSSYTLTIPAHEYRHTAVANIVDNTQVVLQNDDLCSTAELQQETPWGHPLPSHNTGLFSARLDMKVLSNVDQSFDVKLYMVNCASALVLDTSAAPELQDIEVAMVDFADSFTVSDSTYHYDVNPMIMAKDLPVEKGGERCFAAVHFPSRDYRPGENPDTKLVIETTEPFESDTAKKAIWRCVVHVTLPDGKVTQSILNIPKPIRAGQLKILRVRVLDDGSVRPADSTVGVSVSLDWQNGWDFENIPLG